MLNSYQYSNEIISSGFQNGYCVVMIRKYTQGIHRPVYNMLGAANSDAIAFEMESEKLHGLQYKLAK